MSEVINQYLERVVGKTTTSLPMGTGLAKKERKVGPIDTDSRTS